MFHPNIQPVVGPVDKFDSKELLDRSNKQYLVV
jgi:hypothetical protein